MHRPCHLRTQESSTFMRQGPWVMARLKKDAGKLTRLLKEVLAQCPCCAWGPWISWKLVPGDRAKGKVNMDSTSSTWYQKAKEGGQSHEWSPSHLILPQPQPKPQSINPPSRGNPRGGKTSALLWATKPQGRCQLLQRESPPETDFILKPFPQACLLSTRLSRAPIGAVMAPFYKWGCGAQRHKLCPSSRSQKEAKLGAETQVPGLHSSRRPRWHQGMPGP